MCKRRDVIIRQTIILLLEYLCDIFFSSSKSFHYKRPLLGREVTLSELRKMMTSQQNPALTSSKQQPATATAPRNMTSQSCESFAPLKISIQNEGGERKSDMFPPLVTLTLRDEPPDDAFSRLRSTFHSASFVRRSAQASNRKSTKISGNAREHVTEQVPQTPPFIVHDKDSVRAILISAGSKRDNAAPRRRRRDAAGASQALDLRHVATQPQLEKVQEWVSKSPLRDAAREEQARRSRLRGTLHLPPATSTALFGEREAKRKKVSFGDRKNWSYKEEGYMFQ